MSLENALQNEIGKIESCEDLLLASLYSLLVYSVRKRGSHRKNDEERDYTKEYTIEDAFAESFARPRRKEVPIRLMATS